MVKRKTHLEITNRKTATGLLLLLMIILTAIFCGSCSIYLDPERDNPFDPGADGSGGGTAFTESHTPDTNDATSRIIGSSSGNNRGLGQMILYGQDYVPEAFTVWIDPVYPFKELDGSGSPVAVTLQLRVWNWDTKALIASSSASVASGYTGEVEFTIGSVSETVVSDAPVLYAVFLPNAASNGIRGQLESDNTDGYSPALSAELYDTPTANDSSVDDYNEYQSYLRDLRFKLTGRYFN